MRQTYEERIDERQKLINSIPNNDDKRRNQSSRLEWAESSWTRWLHILFWWWINPLLSLGSKRSLTENDLDGLPHNDTSSILLNRLQSYDWSTMTTWEIVNKEFGKEYLIVGLFFVPYVIAHIAQPLLLRQILLSITNTQQSSSGTYCYALLLTTCALINALFFRQSLFYSTRVAVRIRNALTGLIYERLLSVKSAIWQQMNSGQIINLVAGDTRKFENAFTFSHYLWAGSLEGLIIFGILCWIMKPIPTLLGYSALILFIVIQLLIGRKLDQCCDVTASCCDKRVHAFSEFIYGSHIIKMYNWEKLMEDQITEIRQNESASIQRASYYRTFNMSQPLVSTIIMSFVIFSSTWWLEYPLNVVNIFTTLSLIGQMRLNVSFFLTTAIDKVNDVRSASRRIDSFMRLTMTQEQQQQQLPLHIFSTNQQQKGTIVMSNASFSWNDNIPCLSSLNLTIEPSTLVGIVGPVGSGKSSLLAAVLGEMNLIDGQLNTNNSAFAYTAQSSWIFSDTLRNNILLHQTFNEQRYRDVIYACCLDVDLTLFGSSGDLTMIGERGVNLSGGQKARVSLARALYADADIYLIDDPLAAVDRIVAKQIYERCLGPEGLLKNKTRLLVTHQTQFLNEAHQLIFLSHGHIDEQGHLDENMMTKEDNKKKETSELANMLDENIFVPDTKPIISEETSVSDHDSWSLWYRLFAAPPYGKFGLCLLIILLFLSELFYDGTNYWLSVSFSSTNIDQQYLPKFIFTCFCLTLGIVLFNVLHNICFFRVLLHGSNNLHNDMLKGLLHTSIQFFETNPSGRILNRASKDQQVIDDILPEILLDGLISLLTLVGSIIIICLVNPYILVLLIGLVPLLVWICRYYSRSCRQIKNVESITRSPIFDLFSSSFNGLTTIRAFKVKDDFIQSFTNTIDTNTCAYISIQGASQWLTLRLQCIGTFIMFVSALLAIAFRDHIDSSAIALSLMYTITLSGWLQWSIRQLLEVDILMTSAERIHEYAQLPSEEDQHGHQRLVKTSPKWPFHGTVEFRNYSLRHRSGLDTVLKNINIRIESGQKIGIIGRTGAGKSSLFKGIFRFIPQSNIDGEILIDDINISRITLNHLRSHLGIIPQQPILFSGTLRYNLDPFNQYSDEQCWMALEDVQLKQFVSNHSVGLLMPIAESGNNLSVGQCQLICIARAILKKSKILLIDEATANVDGKTDEIIQTVFANKFQDRTVLTIAHRLNTLAKCDRILVLDKGIIMNFDSTMNILQHYQ